MSAGPVGLDNNTDDDCDDVHTCGKCKRVFTDMDMFVEHKRSHAPEADAAKKVIDDRLVMLFNCLCSE